jgi:hypothetical protein
VSPSRQPSKSSRSPSASPRRRTALFWLGVAALLHAEVGLVVGVAIYFLAPRDADLQKQLAEQEPGESIDVGMIDDDAARQIVADLERAEEKHKAAEVEKEVDSVKPPGQVIDLPTPREERRPDEARFAGEHDSTVERETKKYGKFDDKARQGDVAGAAPESHKKNEAEPLPDERLAMRAPNLGRALKMAGPLAAPTPARPLGTSYGVTDPGDTSPDGTFSALAASERRGRARREPVARSHAHERAARARHRRGDAGRAAGHRRWRRDGAQFEEVALRDLLQPRQEAGLGALAPRGGIPAP